MIHIFTEADFEKCRASQPATPLMSIMNVNNTAIEEWMLQEEGMFYPVWENPNRYAFYLRICLNETRPSPEAALVLWIPYTAPSEPHVILLYASFLVAGSGLNFIIAGGCLRNGGV